MVGLYTGTLCVRGADARCVAGAEKAGRERAELYREPSVLRGRQLAIYSKVESLLKAIRANRAKVVVMDVTGVATIDSKVANHILQTVAASRLMGAQMIVTGLSSEVAQSLVALGIELGRLNTVGDLQGGLEEAEAMLGYRVLQNGVGPRVATVAET